MERGRTPKEKNFGDNRIDNIGFHSSHIGYPFQNTGFYKQNGPLLHSKCLLKPGFNKPGGFICQNNPVQLKAKLSLRNTRHSPMLGISGRLAHYPSQLPSSLVISPMLLRNKLRIVVSRFQILIHHRPHPSSRVHTRWQRLSTQEALPPVPDHPLVKTQVADPLSAADPQPMCSFVAVIVNITTHTAFNVQVRDVVENFTIRREKAESGPLLAYPIYFFVSNAVFLRQEETGIGRRREYWQGECIGRNGKPPLLILIHWLAGIK